MIVQKIESVSSLSGEGLFKRIDSLPVSNAGLAKKNDGPNAASANRADAFPDISQAALDLHRTDQTLKYMEKTVSAMKEQLVEMRRTLPPFPPGDGERVRILRGYIGLRQLIDELTIPPPQRSNQIKEDIRLPKLTETSTDQEVDAAVKTLKKTVLTIQQKRGFLGME